MANHAVTYPVAFVTYQLLSAFVSLTMVSRPYTFVYATLASYILIVKAQILSDTPPSSWPQVYPGMPDGNYGPEWQDCMLSFDSLVISKLTVPRLSSN
jgi:hypothetical protein